METQQQWEVWSIPNNCPFATTGAPCAVTHAGALSLTLCLAVQPPRSLSKSRFSSGSLVQSMLPHIRDDAQHR
jgi:hypothetical protein